MVLFLILGSVLAGELGYNIVSAPNYSFHNDCASSFTVTAESFDVRQHFHCEWDHVTLFAAGERKYKKVFCGEDGERSPFVSWDSNYAYSDSDSIDTDFDHPWWWDKYVYGIPEAGVDIETNELHMELYAAPRRHAYDARFDLKITANLRPGFEWDPVTPTTCYDIDECARGTHTCTGYLETCENTVGSFNCPCISGFEKDASGRCEDIDECAEGTHTCNAPSETCRNTVGSFECPCSRGFEEKDGVCVEIDPMPYEDAILLIEEWIDMTTEILETADHDRVGKFDNRMHKLLRNALQSHDTNCVTPYNTKKFGKNDFAVWEREATQSDDVCEQTTTIQAGLYAWVDNYACMDKNSKRQTKRVSKFIEKITNPYC